MARKKRDRNRICAVCGKPFLIKACNFAVQCCSRECGHKLAVASRRRQGKGWLHGRAVMPKLPPEQEAFERMRHIKLLFWLKLATLKRPNSKPEINLAGLREAWADIDKISLAVMEG